MAAVDKVYIINCFDDVHLRVYVRSNISHAGLI